MEQLCFGTAPKKGSSTMPSPLASHAKNTAAGSESMEQVCCAMEKKWSKCAVQQWEKTVLLLLHYAKSYRPFELFVNENYKL